MTWPKRKCYIKGWLLIVCLVTSEEIIFFHMSSWSLDNFKFQQICNLYLSLWNQRGQSQWLSSEHPHLLMQKENSANDKLLQFFSAVKNQNWDTHTTTTSNYFLKQFYVILGALFSMSTPCNTSGFKSRCTTPWRWQYATTLSTWMTIALASSSLYLPPLLIKIFNK